MSTAPKSRQYHGKARPEILPLRRNGEAVFLSWLYRLAEFADLWPLVVLLVVTG